MKEDRGSEASEPREEAGSPAGKPDVEEKEEPVVYEYVTQPRSLCSLMLPFLHCDLIVVVFVSFSSQVKKSTLNPNAKEFNPKSLLAVVSM